MQCVGVSAARAIAGTAADFHKKGQGCYFFSQNQSPKNINEQSGTLTNEHTEYEAKASREQQRIGEKSNNEISREKKAININIH